MRTVVRTSKIAVAMRSRLAQCVTEIWVILLRRCFDPYRPELHYMRGPGPRSREKTFNAPGLLRPNVGQREK
jgi:hypothetical protein